MTLGVRKPLPPVESWWARRWLSLLDDLAPEQEGLLRRARDAAQRGDVANVEVAPGRVSATVYSPFGSSYVANLRLHVHSETTWEHMLAALARYPDVAVRLLTGEMPREMEDVFAAAEGVSIFPRDLFEIESSCGCPMRGSICRHVAALHYRFASYLDKQPFALTTLRGRTQRQIVAGIRAQWRSDESGAGEQPEGVEDEDGTAPLQVAAFFEAGAAIETLDADFTPPAHDAALLRRLGKPPFANSNEDVITPLAAVYEPITRRALAALKQNIQSAKRRSATSQDD